MKLIKPSEISARILTLLDESNERVILVSPYMKISKWYKFKNKVNGLKSRGIHTEIYVRDDPENTTTYRDLDGLELEYKRVHNLHCKLYLNETYGIVSSMNLLLSSEINSLEIGYATESREEYNDLLHFYHRYIQIGTTIHDERLSGLRVAVTKELLQIIREELERRAMNSWICLADGAMHITTGKNNYIVTIIDGSLRITAHLLITSATMRKGVQHSALIAKKVKDLTSMKVDMHAGLDSYPSPHTMPGNMPGTKSSILELSGQVRISMKSTCITRILQEEAAYLIESIIRFIDTIENLERM